MSKGCDGTLDDGAGHREGRGRSGKVGVFPFRVNLSPPQESCLSPRLSVFRRPHSGPSESLQTVGEDGGTALGAALISTHSRILRCWGQSSTRRIGGDTIQPLMPSLPVPLLSLLLFFWRRRGPLGRHVRILTLTVSEWLWDWAVLAN